MYKYILLGFLCFATTTFNAQNINWVNMNKALELQEQQPKKIMVFFYAEWCKNCHKMNETTFVNKDVIKYINKHYYAVNFNGEGTETVNYKDFEYTNPNYNPNLKGQNYQHLFADALQIKMYPTVMFFDEKSEIISPVAGFKTAKELEIFLKMVATNDYKNVRTAESWQEYQDSFKPTFKVK